MAEPGSSPPQRRRMAPIPAGIRVLQALAITVGACLVVVRLVAIDAASSSASDTLRPWIIQCAVIVSVAALVVVALERRRARGG